jgi:hypothetical protein
MSRKSVGTVEYRYSTVLKQYCWHARFTRGDRTRTPWIELDPSLRQNEKTAAQALAASFAYYAKACTKDGPIPWDPTPVEAPTRGGIYFLQSEGPGNPVKIGVSTNSIRRRVNSLKTAHPWPVKLVGWIPGDKDVERKLHSQFGKNRLHGEWFELTEELRTFIQSIRPALE